MGELKNNQMKYTGLSINQKNYILNQPWISQGTVPDSYVENFLQVGMQINGNKAIDPSHGNGVDPVIVYLEEVSFEGYTKS